MRKNKTGKNMSLHRICLFRILLIFIMLFLILNFSLMLSGCSEASTKIKKVQEVLSKEFSEEPSLVDEAVICKNVDDNFAPLEPLDIFPSGTDSIYLSVKFSNLAQEDVLKVVWTYTDTQKQLSIQEFSPPEKSSGFHSFNIKITGAFPAGFYTAEIFLNDRSVKKLEFSVK